MYILHLWQLKHENQSSVKTSNSFSNRIQLFQGMMILSLVGTTPRRGDDTLICTYYHLLKLMWKSHCQEKLGDRGSSYTVVWLVTQT